jgi:hypothetical protein
MEVHTADLMSDAVDVIVADGRCSSSCRAAGNNQHSNSGFY